MFLLAFGKVENFKSGKCYTTLLVAVRILQTFLYDDF